MDTSPLLGERLRLARERAGLNQQAASRALDLDRVNLSYWENGKRTPGLAQLEQLARAYATNVTYLLGDQENHEPEHTTSPLYDTLSPNDHQGRQALSRWLHFLERWADLLEETGEPLPGRGISALPEGRTTTPITDSRRAPTLALRTREVWELGNDAIPDLAALLDNQGILVCYGNLGENSDISGVFYNHPRLGFCILVNRCHRPGRQLFTLAHELAHALFHHQEHGLISRAQVRDPKEKFADSFAAHFLVTRPALEAAVSRRPVRDPYDVVWLQLQFRVSYAMLLNRLYNEGFILQKQYEEYRGYSPTALAKRLQVDTTELQTRTGTLPELEAFAPSIIDKVIVFLQDDILSPSAAASLLDVPVEVITLLIDQHEKASQQDRQEFDQLPTPAAPRLSARVRVKEPVG